MIEKTTVKRSAGLTRQRILDAAVRRFSRHSYEATTLRDIAADVGVDVALVHRSFGSKEELFQQAARSAFSGDFPQAVAAPDLGAALTAFFVRSRLESAPGIDPLDIVTRSLSSDKASPILRALIEQDFIRPLALRLGNGEEARAAMAIACLVGVVLLRDVLGIASLCDADAAAMSRLIAKLMGACLGPAAEAEYA